MKIVATLAIGAAMCCPFAGTIAAASEPLAVQIQPKGPNVEVVWPGKSGVRVGGVRFSTFEVQQSFDLQKWQAIETIPANQDGANYRLEKPAPSQPAFYRVVGSVAVNPAPVGGEEVFGYQDTFNTVLSDIGQISPEQFATRFALTNEYLEQISFDPTNALFWAEFNGPPKSIYDPFTGSVTIDFRVNADELAVLRKYGFVVSEAKGTHSFAESFYRIYIADLPVFVSTDAILQAWHRSYAELLGELESLYLLPVMSNLVTVLHERIPDTWPQHGSGPLGPSIRDVDYFLTVARCLFTSNNIPSKLGQDTLVQGTLGAINNGQLQSFALFGRRNGSAPHQFDFSRFIVRGYYAKTAELRRYFRGMTWLSLVDFRVAGNPDDPSPRELGSAVVLQHLLAQAGQYTNWANADQVIRTFVGIPDSMGFEELNRLLTSGGITSLSELTSAKLAELQQAVLTGSLGIQAIQGHALHAPFGPEQLVLPRSFTLFGPRFTFDSWALNQVVFDRILWDTNGIAELADKVMRRMPSALDVAFGVLGNDATLPELLVRLTNSAGRSFRDGLPYQHNLAAVRLTVDAQHSASWNDSIYNLWLAALRELSAPTTGPMFPEAMRTRAWAHKTLTTQLASWTHLRHNSVLYTKESYTPDVLCIYPYGYVEPRIGFWNRMRSMADRSAALLQSLPYEGTAVIPQPKAGTYQPPPLFVPLTNVQAAHVAFLTNFSATMTMLEDISAKELAQQPLTTNEQAFLQDIIERQITYFGARRFTGWYPALFYTPFRKETVEPMLHRSDEWDPVITSVHTDQPDVISGDPGGVLHEAVGNVNLMMIAVDNGPDRMIYAGPVFSYYELTTTGVTRLTDQDWKNHLLQTNLPPVPDWDRAYKVPGSITIPSYAR